MTSAEERHARVAQRFEKIDGNLTVIEERLADIERTAAAAAALPWWRYMSRRRAIRAGRRLLAETRALLAYLGLPFDAACLRFFDTERPVATPSSEQVRQPIFTDAVDHWRQFEPWLDPLKAALGRVLEAYPAAP